MPTLSADRRRALELLADSVDGYTEAVVLAHGITSRLIAGLVRAGLVTTETAHKLAGGRAIYMTRIKITDAGRRALAEVRRGRRKIAKRVASSVPQDGKGPAGVSRRGQSLRRVTAMEASSNARRHRIATTCPRTAQDASVIDPLFILFLHGWRARFRGRRWPRAAPFRRPRSILKSRVAPFWGRPA
jgi:hypothetical protein